MNSLYRAEQDPLRSDGTSHVSTWLRRRTCSVPVNQVERRFKDTRLSRTLNVRTSAPSRIRPDALKERVIRFLYILGAPKLATVNKLGGS
jgi:hypothetical protein